jgi:hypothetical protein
MLRPSLPRVLAHLVLVTACSISPAFAQAPVTGPLVLHIPSSARTAALANAWVAGRDLDVIFHNPAQLIGARTSGVDLSLARLGPASKMISMGSIYTGGRWSMTFGWGVQILGFSTDAVSSYPFSQEVTLAPGDRNGTSALVTFGGAVLIKGFRVGAAAKYVTDIASTPAAQLNPMRINQHMVLGDFGVARNIFGGQAALAVQNIGKHSQDAGVPLKIPRQISVGYSHTRIAGPFDLAGFSQVTVRKGWVAPALGVEAGYSWIEGTNVTLRAGVKRPETDVEKPVSLGAAFTLDRFTVEYALRLFDAGRQAHGVTLRWR